MHEPSDMSVPHEMYRRRVARLIFGVAALALLAATLDLAWGLAERAGINDLTLRAGHRLDVYAASLEGELAKYDYLPTILPLEENVVELLRRPTDAGLISAVNHYLEQF